MYPRSRHSPVDRCSGRLLLPLLVCTLALSACSSKKAVDEQPFSTAIVSAPLVDAPSDVPGEPPFTAATEKSSAPHPGPAAASSPRTGARLPQGQRHTLEDAVFSAVTGNPKIGIASARARQAGANINIARAGAKPQVDAQVGTGFDAKSNFEGRWNKYDTRADTHNPVFGSKLTLRKLIYDFGATQANIERAEKLYAAELFRRFDRAEDLASKTIDAYLRVHEQRQLLSLTRQNLTALNEIGDLVRANEAGGNATTADVSRVETMLSEARKGQTDQEAALETALDSFRRLTGLELADLAAPTSPRAHLPGNPREAERLIETGNPQLLALKIMGEAFDAEIKSVEAGNMPKLELEIEGSSDFYTGGESRQESAFKAMVYMRKNLYDGGTRAAEIDQLRARREETDMRYFDVRDELIFDLRRHYRAVESARQKQADLTAAVQASSDVQRLYREQFKAGKRTLFELLDSQTAYFNARQDQISNQHESLRAEYDILRTTGTLLSVMFPG